MLNCSRHGVRMNPAHRTNSNIRLANVRRHRIIGQSSPNLAANLKILTVNDEQYVLLDEVQDQLKRAGEAKIHAETKQFSESAALLQQEQEAHTQRVQALEQALKAAQAEAVDAKAAMETAMLKAAQQLEHRFEVAYHTARDEEISALQAQLEAAQEAAKAAEEKALDAVRAASEETTQRSQEAAQKVASDSMSIVAAARGATGVAQLAAEEAEASAQRSVEQQMQSLALVKDIQAHAEEAEQRAGASHQQAKGLAAEVMALRDALAAAQTEAAEAAGRAVEAEKAVAERIAVVNKEMQAQLVAVEKALEEFRKVERQRVKEALDQAATLSKQNAGLVGESKNLRAALAAAEHAVAQADGRAAAAVAALQQKEATMGALFKERLAVQAQELQAQILTEQLEGQQERWHEVASEVKAVAASIDGVEQEAAGQVAAMRRAIEAQGYERTYWRSRCLKAEGEARMASLHLKQTLDTLDVPSPATPSDAPSSSPPSSSTGPAPPAANSSAAAAGGPAPRAANQERLWQFMASGPRGPSNIAMEGAVVPEAPSSRDAGGQDGEPAAAAGGTGTASGRAQGGA